MIAKIVISCVFMLGVLTLPVRAQMLSDVEDLTEHFLYNNTLWPIEAEKGAWLYDTETASTAGYYAYELDLNDSAPPAANPVKGLLAVNDTTVDVLLDPTMFDGPTPLFVDTPSPSIIDSGWIDRMPDSSSASAPDRSSETATPEPKTLLMIGLALAGFGFWARRRMRRSTIGG